MGHNQTLPYSNMQGGFNQAWQLILLISSGGAGRFDGWIDKPTVYGKVAMMGLSSFLIISKKLPCHAMSPNVLCLRRLMDKWYTFPCYGSTRVLSVVRTRHIWVEVRWSWQRPLSDGPSVSGVTLQLLSNRLFKTMQNRFSTQITFFILIRHFSEQRDFSAPQHPLPPSPPPPISTPPGKPVSMSHDSAPPGDQAQLKWWRCAYIWADSHSL